MTRGRSIDPEEFVRAWQASGSIEEISRKTGMNAESVRARGHRFRKKGVPLRKFATQGRPATDWAALKKLAEELVPKK